MKKIPVLLLSLMTIPAQAQVWSALSDYQESLKPAENHSSSSTSAPEVKPSTGSTSSSSKMCEENDQTSLPLKILSSLILEKNGQLEIVHDQRTGKLKVTSPDMIGNCSSMIDWTLHKPELEGEKAYAVEAKFKKPGSYKYFVMKKDGNPETKDGSFPPTLQGFEKCLETSGVIKDGKVDPNAIVKDQVDAKFEGADYSGNLLFVSHGKVAAQVKPKYGGDSFKYRYECDYYEAAHPTIGSLMTHEDAEKVRLSEMAKKLKEECEAGVYSNLADFIDKYEGFAFDLGKVRDASILKAAEKSALAIEKGTYKDEDLKVIADFDKYIIQPLADDAVVLYNQMIEADEPTKIVLQNRLKGVLSELTKYNKKPYFLSSHTMKLLKKGNFDEAEKLNSMKLTIDSYQRIGTKQDNVVITPTVAAQRVANGKATFASSLEDEKEKFEYRTGQSTGKSQYYTNLASRMRSNIQTRNQNFTAEIQEEYARVQQPNGYCYKYWRNTQKCIQDSMERIQELQALLQHYNKVDEERAAEYDAKAREYGELEAQGRRHVATENGEAPPVETNTTTTPAAQDTTVPNPRPQSQDSGVYSFNFNQGQQGNQQMYQQQAQMTPQQYQYPTNPYQNNNMFMQQQPYGYQQQYMGQQNFGGGMNYNYNYGSSQGYGYQPQGAYNFNWGGSGMQQPYGQQQYMGQQQQYPQQGGGYWNRPYQAYGGMSLYGGW
jgi:hypothetical protein